MAAAEELRLEVEGELSLEQSLVEEIVELLRLLPCIVGNTGHMLHIRRKLRMDLGLLHRSTERIEQRNQLPLSDFLLQVLKEW